MNILLIILIIVFVTSLLFVFFVRLRSKDFGVLTGKKVYQDTEKTPGDIIYSTTLSLSGKPDYILQERGSHIPIEIKTGKTPPVEPYQNHIMQLMAYCYLVEEKYGEIIPGGVIKYPGKEYKIQYTEEAKKAIQSVVREMLSVKQSNKEFACRHANHNS